MALQIVMDIYVSGEATEKETFLTELESAVTSSGWTISGGQYLKTVAYTTDSQAQSILFYDLVQSKRTSGIYVSVTTTASNVLWEIV